ncbi:MAG: LysM peptidoglycan-binding domain-containing protein [Anaerolineae bacterium]|nr:LysM peptidoglycan-binding domain-containing protein [Anaerolineae bacterium]
MSRIVSLFLFVVCLMAVPVPGGVHRALAQGFSAYDLIAAVNSLRAEQGLPPLNVNESLMVAAQGQSEYMAQLGTWSHEGPGGSTPKSRAAAAGYGSGATIYISENVAQLSSSTGTLEYLLYTVWADAIHWNTMTNVYATDVGAGVAAAGGYVFYTLDVGYVSGVPASSNTSAPGTVQATSPSFRTPFVTRPPTEMVKPVLTVTPNPDGKIVHVVEIGQTLWSIAVAYGVKIADITRLNGMPTNSVSIYEGQKLLIQPAFTLTPTSTETLTPLPPSRTPRPTSTRNLTPLVFTSQPTATETIQPLLPGQTEGELNPRNLGRVIIAISAFGILAVLASYLLKRK